MKQEDINELLAKHPSPEARIQYEERVYEANIRGCACKDNPSGWNSECFYQNHQMSSKTNAKELNHALGNYLL